MLAVALAALLALPAAAQDNARQKRRHRPGDRCGTEEGQQDRRCRDIGQPRGADRAHEHQRHGDLEHELRQPARSSLGDESRAADEIADGDQPEDGRDSLEDGPHRD